MDLKSEIHGPFLSKLQVTVFFFSPIVNVVRTSSWKTEDTKHTISAAARPLCGCRSQTLPGSYIHPSPGKNETINCYSLCA